MTVDPNPPSELNFYFATNKRYISLYLPVSKYRATKNVTPFSILLSGQLKIPEIFVLAAGSIATIFVNFDWLSLTNPGKRPEFQSRQERGTPFLVLKQFATPTCGFHFMNTIALSFFPPQKFTVFCL